MMVSESLVDSGDCMSTAEDYDGANETTIKNAPLVPSSGKSQQMATVEALAGIGENASIHNFHGSKTEIWRALTMGENMAQPLSAMVGQGPIEVVNWYLHRVRIEQADGGEIIEPVRTVLYTADGKILAAVSEGIVKAVATIIKTFGLGPYNPPIKVEVMAIKTSSKFTMLTLVPAE